MFQDIFTAIPLGFFLAFLLGPVFFVLLETAAIKGFRAALSFDIPSDSEVWEVLVDCVIQIETEYL